MFTFACADLYIYAVNQYDPVNEDPGGGILSGFSFFAGPPDCKDVGQSITYNDLDDVSQSDGVRCEGCGTGAGGFDIDITVLEWHIGSQHYS